MLCYTIKIKQTALHYAVENENIEIIQFLLTNDKIDVNIVSKYKKRKGYETRYETWNMIIQTTLYLAVEKENIEIIQHLLTNDKIDVNIINKRIQELKDCDTEFKEKTILETRTALYLAVEKENIEIIKLLLTNDKIDVNIINKHGIIEQTALYLAVEKENIEIIKLLLTNDKIDVNIKNKFYDEQTALYLAVEKENIEIIKLFLVNDKIDVNIICKRYKRKKHPFSREWTWDLNRYTEQAALYLAVEKENIEIIKLLLKNDKIDVNIINKYYDTYNNVCTAKMAQTALYLAVEKGNIEIIKLLLTNDKIDVNIINEYYEKKGYSKKDETAQTVLNLAIEKENIEIIKLLLTNDKIDLNIINKYNDYYYEGGYGGKYYTIKEQAALYLAVEKEIIEIIKLLLTNDKIDINIINKCNKTKVLYGETKTNKCETPLHLSISKKKL